MLQHYSYIYSVPYLVYFFFFIIDNAKRICISEQTTGKEET